MGFPRIVSKNNKIYTKLGEFCLSSDGTNFWILCHTCQEELQSQDHFWKHIQDEHNFLHIKESSNSRTTSYMDCSETTILPLPLYRKIHSDSEDNVPRTEMTDHDEEDEEHSQQPKDYTDMRNAISTRNAVAIDIKVEPPSASSNNNNNNNNNATLSLTAAVEAAAAAQHQQAASTALQLQGHNATLYQLPASVVPTASTAVNATYATIVHPATGATLTMPHPPQATMQQGYKEELLVPKESNSTTASASSAVSSDDGERWYICEHESCGLKFKYQSRLELHRSVHSKERKFACEICGASFKQSCNLSTHRKKKHFLKGTKNLTILPQQQQQPTQTAHTLQASQTLQAPQQMQQHTQQQQQQQQQRF